MAAGIPMSNFVHLPVNLSSSFLRNSSPWRSGEEFPVPLKLPGDWKNHYHMDTAIKECTNERQEMRGDRLK